MDAKWLLLDSCGDIIFSSDSLAAVGNYRHDWVEYFNEEQDSNHTAKDFPIYERTDY